MSSAEKPVKAKKKANDCTTCFWPLFTAISDVMMQAKKGRLEPEDLLALPTSDNVSEQSETLKKSWERTLRHFHRDQAAKKAAELANPAAAAAAKKKKKEELPSLSKALWPQVRRLWRVAFGLYICSTGLAFLGPFLLGRTVQLLQTTQQCGLREQQQASVELESEGNLLSDESPTISAACREESRIHLGYIYAAAMLVVKMCEALFRSWHDHLMTRLALRARAAIIGTIYRKCLWLSGMGAGDTTTGRIQNLMANDAQFFLQIAPMFNNLFVAPLHVRRRLCGSAPDVGELSVACTSCSEVRVPALRPPVRPHVSFTPHRAAPHGNQPRAAGRKDAAAELLPLALNDKPRSVCAARRYTFPKYIHRVTESPET